MKAKKTFANPYTFKQINTEEKCKNILNKSNSIESLKHFQLMEKITQT